MGAAVDLPLHEVRDADSRSARVAALWGLLLAKTIGAWGVQWDIRWHVIIGRDSFWIAPHVMTYAGVALTAALSVSVLVLDTFRARRRADADDHAMTVIGITGTPGWHLAWWGIALTILAAPIDDLWHRLFGIDVTLWSPPHLLGIAGAQINTLGVMAIALELWPAGSGRRAVALIWAGTLLLGGFAIVVDPAVQTAFRYGGLFFFTWPVLGALAFGFTLVLVARLTDASAAPLAVALGAFALHLVGLAIGDAGFALVQPVSTIREAIAADPTSPIAIAHEMARRGGRGPGRVIWLRAFPIVPAALMLLLDSPRRSMTAAAGFGLALLAVAGIMLSGSPALAHALPTAAEVPIAVALAAGAALAGGAVAIRLAARLAPVPVTRNAAPA